MSSTILHLPPDIFLIICDFYTRALIDTITILVVAI
jgi:hypothetical protein